jgi:dihydrofolate reductase
MGGIVVTEYISVDVVEGPSGMESFERVGWTDAFGRGPEGDQFKLDEVMNSEAMLLGRVTYDGFPPVWPHHKGELAEKFNAMPKYVVSQTLTDPEWNNTTVLSGDAVDEARTLKERYDRDVVVYGSPQLTQTLIEHDLVDALNCRSTPSLSAPASACSGIRAGQSGCGSRPQRPSVTVSRSSSRSETTERGWRREEGETSEHRRGRHPRVAWPRDTGPDSLRSRDACHQARRPPA